MPFLPVGPGDLFEAGEEPVQPISAYSGLYARGSLLHYILHILVPSHLQYKRPHDPSNEHHALNLQHTVKPGDLHHVLYLHI
jgi:hypothetical protein